MSQHLSGKAPYSVHCRAGGIGRSYMEQDSIRWKPAMSKALFYSCDEAEQSLCSSSWEKHNSRFQLARGSVEPVATDLWGLTFNSGCDLCFTNWKREMTLIPVKIMHDKYIP